MSSKKTKTKKWIWLKRHFPALLLAWFWLGMVLCGLLAPPDRVAMLESELVHHGWQLSLMSFVFGGTVMSAYVLRVFHSKR